MSSKIEQRIDEIEDYIGGCKYLTFSKSEIRVNRDEIEELLHDLKADTPDEIRRYQKMIAQREAILEDARNKAQALIDKTTQQTNELINENEIMQQAYAQANEVITMANKKGQDIVDNATIEANQLKESAQQYLENILTHLNELLTSTLNSTNAHYESFYNSLSSVNEAINNDMAELHPEITDDSGDFSDIALNPVGKTPDDTDTSNESDDLDDDLVSGNDDNGTNRSSDR